MLTAGQKALVVSCFDWYENRVRYVRESLEARCFDVTVLLADFDHLGKRKVVNRHNDCKYIEVPVYERNISIARMRSHKAFANGVRGHLHGEKPDLVYLLLPPNYSARYCQQYRDSNPDTIFVLDIVDLWPESLPLLKGRFPLAHQWANLRNDAIQVADLIFTECNYYKEILKGILPEEKTRSLLLCKPLSEEENRSIMASLAKQSYQDASINKITFGYLGSINNIIDIDTICRLLHSFKSRGLGVDVHVIGAGESKNTFLAALESEGCSVYYHGVVYDMGKKVEILEQCDFGLNIMKETVAVGLSLKSVEYFAMGIPIANSIQGDTWALVANRAVGFNVGDGCVEIALSMIGSSAGKLRKRVRQCYDDLFSPEAFRTQMDAGLNAVLHHKEM